MSPLPRRPRLAEHALARRHLAGGEPRVVLHDTRRGGLIALGPREWTLLSCADGTRDLDGIVAAAARAGAHARAPALRAFLEQLHGAGLLADGAEPAGAAAPPPEPAPPDRPLSLLPDFSLRCDGRGSCCRIYATVLFAPLEVARARAVLPGVLDAGDAPERAFLPERGAGPCPGSAVAMVDGRCAYLADAGRCALHEAAGPASKPLGCQLFPATLADDGEEIRASVAVECACVLASVGLSGGAPILPPRAEGGPAPATRADLDPAVHIAVLPERVALRPGVSAPRRELAAWSRRVAAAPAPADAPAALWALAAAVDRAGLDLAAAERALALAAPPAPAALLPWLSALARRAGRRAAEDAAWRGERDLARRAATALAGAASALLEPAACAAALAPRASAPEAFYVRAAIHGHHLAGDAPLATALRDRAVRVVIARAIAPWDDAASEHPLALVEAMMRGHGLDAYAHDLP